ncbi:IscS subfamily cysteine desulfurase [Aquibacillus koreensis]|uniref:IscS subfamily cysteine desulfurase n=1 Tax=Aquibacillus koreensis TaxID=279446 RepID=A0A9X4AIB8_9BACI|nr:IscS subfamily cysteine desulfurase [Aquibacillus koreensis]MCT2537971.1 IscS subfamily cysteine desulfurase [Aquibacillus koreensis]MDC3419138.1 IscS subfamily cysteine desulfurase [Aquibacillus koreensis]
MIYLDYAATTPMSTQALQVYSEVSKNYFGNANSLHDLGTSSKDIVTQCKIELAKFIEAPSNGIFFTSGGTESNMLAIQNLLKASQNKGKHIITTAIEHSSLFNYFNQLEKEHGYTVTYLGIDKKAQVDIQHIQQAITSETVLVSIQHANSEIGAIQSLKEIGDFLHKHDVLFHSDCVQTFGKIPISVKACNLDSISISSHKNYGPKGVGAIYLNPNLVLYQPTNVKPGTTDVAGVAAFIAAMQENAPYMEKEYQRIKVLRDLFVSEVVKRDIAAEVLTFDQQMPHIISLLLDRVKGDYAMLEFNRAGIAISTGSACSIGHQEPSRTILALGKSADEAKRLIRLSLGKSTEQADLEKAAKVCQNIISHY